MRDYDLRDRTTSAVLAEKAARIGERPFLHWDGKTFTYGDLEELTNRYANGLLDLGVQRGDHVALLLENGPEFLWALWGLGKIGAVAVPLNTAAKGAMLQYFLDHSDSVALIAAGELLPRVNEVVGELSKLRTVVGHGISEAELAEMITMPGLRLATTSDLAAAPAAKPESEEAVAWNDPHLILFTSGTTGPSKGVVSPHAQGHAVGRQMARFNGYTSEDVLYTCLPVFHGNALWYTVYAALWADASVALYPHFSARRFWDQVRESRATVFNCLGAMANIVWQQPRTSLDQEHSVRLCMLVPNSKALAVGFRERYNIGVTSVYAMTENCAVTVFTTDDPIEKAPSAGRVRQDVAVRIVGDDGQPLPPGAVGEIYIRPEEPGSLMLGYYKMPQETADAMQDLWFHSGDLGSLDTDGYLYFSDRKKEAIRRRGENISAYEVETIICRHPAVQEAAAVPVPSTLSEDELVVFLVPVPGQHIDEAALIAFCDEHMPYYMVPRYLGTLRELPKTPSEKIEKYKLKALAADHVSELWDREAAGIVLHR